MEKIKQYYFLLLLLFIASSINSQSTEVIRPGLIRVMSTISPSKMLSSNNAYFYLHGNLEVYLSKKISVCGDGFYFLGSQTQNPSLAFMHNLFYGFSYHFTKGNNDFYLSLQQGVAISKVSENLTSNHISSVGLSPVISTIAGYNFYVSRFFHFFVQSRLTLGEHNYDVHQNISDIRLSAGLGFNINALKSK
ncbi:MAG: hypothetical protein JSU07_02970 [Bacteroidetes bacterium]|nr:hypothetical protein [Bacteroidota bacterium]